MNKVRATNYINKTKQKFYLKRIINAIYFTFINSKNFYFFCLSEKFSDQILL